MKNNSPLGIVVFTFISSRISAILQLIRKPTRVSHVLIAIMSLLYLLIIKMTLFQSFKIIFPRDYLYGITPSFIPNNE